MHRGDADQGEGLQHINVCQSILISYLAGFSMFICYEWVTTLWKIEYSLAYKVHLDVSSRQQHNYASCILVQSYNLFVTNSPSLNDCCGQVLLVQSEQLSK